MAEKCWPGQNPIGHWFGNGNDRSRWFQVVGVIGNIRSFGLAYKAQCEFYQSIDQREFSTMTAVIRVRGDDLMAVVPSARKILASLDPGLPITNVQTLDSLVSRSVGQPRMMSALTGLFGGLAGLLALVGIYSVMAYGVRRQRHEFGVRMALGAGPREVNRMVLSRGLLLALLGVGIGAVGAYFFAGLLKTLLYDMQPVDPAVFAGTAVAVLLVGLLASYLPARSAARVDPMIVLRNE
jgi:putative ABC transport system permease protein